MARLEKSRPTTSAPRCASLRLSAPKVALQMNDPLARDAGELRGFNGSEPRVPGAEIGKVVTTLL